MLNKVKHEHKSSTKNLLRRTHCNPNVISAREQTSSKELGHTPYMKRGNASVTEKKIRNKTKENTSEANTISTQSEASMNANVLICIKEPTRVQRQVL